MTRISKVKNEAKKMENRLLSELDNVGLRSSEIDLKNTDFIVMSIFPYVTKGFIYVYWQYMSAVSYVENYDFYKEEESKEDSDIFYPYIH